MPPASPGLNPVRLVHLMQGAVTECGLDLSDAVVLTEAASGPYIVTPVLAAMAGARQVFALTRTTSHGTVEQIHLETMDLARRAGVEERISVITKKSREIVGMADVVTNSGHVRPIDAEMVSWMRPTAVLPLMYEAWEFRPGDLDLAACRERGIQVAGTNERHPAVDVFSFLGVMAIKLLLEAGVSVYRSRILLLCDNDFRDYIRRALVAAGASVQTGEGVDEIRLAEGVDAILLALDPQKNPPLAGQEAQLIAECLPGTVVAQFWGDVDRNALAAAGIPLWPPHSVPPGHMGILPSAVGPEPVVRLQAGGLKVGEVLRRPEGQRTGDDRSFLDVLFV